jgi:hypothetical protein
MNDTILVWIALVLVLVLAGGFYVIWARINAIPARLQVILMQECERGEREAIDALRQAIRKVEALTQSLRDVQEQLAAGHRAEVFAAEARAREAETRASAAEREATEAASVLSAAIELVSGLRAFRDTLGTRARAAEREATEAASVLSLAFELVGELRALLEAVGAEQTASGPLRVPERRPPPVPRAPLPPQPEPEEGQPALGAEEKKS